MSRYDEALKGTGVSSAQFTLLRRLARLERASLTGLADSARLDRSTTGRNIRVLEKYELVQRSTGKDQREQIFELTPRGQQVLAEALPRWRRAQEDLEAELGEEKAREFRALLHAVS